MLYKTGNFSLCSGIVKSLANALFRGPSKESVFNVCGMVDEFSCPDCPRTFGRKDALRRHLKTVNCKKSPKKKGRIYTPTTSRIVIDGELTPVTRGSEKEKWPCPLCGTTFRRAKIILRHIKSGACPARKAQRSVLRVRFPLNCRTSSTISHPDEPINSIEGGPGRGNVSQRVARVDFERNMVSPEGREEEYTKYREGVGPTHPYRYKSLHYPFSGFSFVSDPHGIGN